jgi:hypothetical protein
MNFKRRDGVKKIQFRKVDTVKIAWSGTFLALAMVLPALVGHIPEIGRALSPIHIPIFICGFVLGPYFGAIVGALAPLLNFFVTGMPQPFPSGIAMMVELAVYGFVAGFVFRFLRSGKIGAKSGKIGALIGFFERTAAGIYLSLIVAMLVGRLFWGLARFILAGFGGSGFIFKSFIAGAFVNALPAWILHIVLIPLIIFALQRAKVILPIGGSLSGNLKESKDGGEVEQDGE